MHGEATELNPGTALLDGELVTLPGSIRIRCYAHLIATIAKDIDNHITASLEIRKRVDKAKEFKGLLKEGHQETRWNAAYRMILETIKHEALISEFLDFHDWAGLKTTADLPRPFQIATDIVQAEHADGFSALLALETLTDGCSRLAAARESLKSLHAHFFNDAIVLMIYFSPTTNRAEFEDLRPYAEEKLKELYHAHGRETRSSKTLDKELEELHSGRHPRLKGIARMSSTSYKAGWAKWAGKALPILFSLICDIVDISPTEAGVERVFSDMKRCVGTLRASLGASTVRSLLLLKSYLSWRKPMENSRKYQIEERAKETRIVKRQGEAAQQQPRPTVISILASSDDDVQATDDSLFDESAPLPTTENSTMREPSAGEQSVSVAFTLSILDKALKNIDMDASAKRARRLKHTKVNNAAKKFICRICKKGEVGHVDNHGDNWWNCDYGKGTPNHCASWTQVECMDITKATRNK